MEEYQKKRRVGGQRPQRRVVAPNMRGGGGRPRGGQTPLPSTRLSPLAASDAYPRPAKAPTKPSSQPGHGSGVKITGPGRRARLRLARRAGKNPELQAGRDELAKTLQGARRQGIHPASRTRIRTWGKSALKKRYGSFESTEYRRIGKLLGEAMGLLK